MKCPRCNEGMEFEDIKNWHGFWFCQCGYEANGSRIPCDYDCEGGTYVATDHEEQIEPYKESPTYEDLKDMDGDARYHAKVDDELEGGKDG